MKISKNYLKATLFIFVYLFALYLWTLPFQKNKLPYGEFDAISHFEVADYTASNDKSIIYLPSYIDFRYGRDNSFKQHTLWYHPPFHTDLAIISSFSNARTVPIYLANAIFASSILISVFFVINSLFGFLPAILSSFMLTFSMRDIMPYLWGQWPERFAYAFIPLVLYCFYMYYTTYSKEQNKPIYLYIMSLLLGINLFMHPLVFFHSLIGILVLGVALAIRQRKIPVNFKHIALSLVIFLILFSIFPYQSGNVVVSFTKGSSEEKKASLSRLLQWAPNSKDFEGSVPSSYFSFSDMHGLWTLPFLLLGILALVIRRENKDIFLLAWLVSLYLVLHRDLIGSATFLHRSLSASAHIFIPITVIGALSLSKVKLPKIYQYSLKYGAALLIVVLTLVYNMPVAYSTLADAYSSPFARLNQAQIEASEWIKNNADESTNISVIGTPQQLMQKVYWMASYSQKTSLFFEGFLTWRTFEKNRNETIRYHLLNDYIVMDYSDIALLSDRRFVEQWQAFEQQNLAEHTLLYNKNNIRVYKYEAKA